MQDTLDHTGMCKTDGCLYDALLDVSNWCPVCRPDDYTKQRPKPASYAYWPDADLWAPI